MTAFTFRAKENNIVYQEKTIFQQDTPQEIVHLIFAKLHPSSVLKYRRLCRRINQALLDPHFALLNLQPWIPAIWRHLASHSPKKRLLERQAITEFIDEYKDCSNSIADFDCQWFIWPSESHQLVYANHVLRHVNEIKVSHTLYTWSRVNSIIGHVFQIPSTIELLTSLTVLELCGFVKHHEELEYRKASDGEPEDWEAELHRYTGQQFKSKNSKSEVIRLFNGHIPREIGNLSCLKVLNLSRNALTGEIPGEITRLAKLERLDLSDNKLSGKLPRDFGKLVSLQELYLRLNEFTGSLPVTFSGLRSLTTLNVFQNKLSGTMENMTPILENLVTVDLSHNEFSGPLPEGLWNVKLKRLDISNNGFTGGIPRPVFETNIKGLFISGNKMEGQIPKGFADKIRSGRIRSDLLIQSEFTESVDLE
ncbi:hypothetical protein BDR26DRAFT_919939 [Obelidium mucronatum]|nr:hypothetical protein BDR26DRAFT_919939 [Obelidium mucronatum]